MERVEGVSLRHVVARDGRLPPRRACAIAAQILSALGAAHDAGILHRDVKPANVLVMQSPAGDLMKVTDFGIARKMDAQPNVTATLARPAPLRLTGSNDVIGTVGFIAPEQLRGEPCDARADLYGVGATLWQMLAAARPFEGMSAEQYVSAALAGPPRLDADALSIDRALADVVAKAMATNPADRFPNARAFLAALERWTDPRSVAATVAMPARAPMPELMVVQRPTPEGGSRTVSWILVVVAILVLLVVASMLAKVRRAQDSGVEIHVPR
jgi:serine/threonine-protein kinase